MIPQQLIQSLQNIAGFNEHSFLEVHQSGNQITSIRLNPLKQNGMLNNEQEMANNEGEIANEDVIPDSQFLIPNSQKIPWCQHGYYLPQRPYFTHDPLFHAGAYYVQEASSMFLWEVLKQTIASNTQKTVLDLCAAPGGKSTLLASYFTNGFIVSNEVIKQRASVLVENITKWGANNVVVTNNDPKDFKPLQQFFDVVVIDAPCSGSGLFRKDKEAINEWSIDNVNLCSQRQQRIVADIANCVNEDGILIYSTCSYSKAENEDMLDWIIDAFGFTSIALQQQNEWGIIQTISDKNNAYGYRFYPDKVKGEGFFIAAFKKQHSTNAIVKFKETQLIKTTKKEAEVVEGFIGADENNFLFNQKEAVRLFPNNWKQQLQILAAHLYIKKAGIELGCIKGKDFVPSHELAMSNINIINIANVDINKEQALQYLSKKEVNINTNCRGWVLVTHQNIRLGWIKVLPNRFNNYYPTEWRILKTIF